MIDRQRDRQRDRETGRQTDGQRGRFIDAFRGFSVGSQKDRQTDRHLIDAALIVQNSFLLLLNC